MLSLNSHKFRISARIIDVIGGVRPGCTRCPPPHPRCSSSGCTTVWVQADLEHPWCWVQEGFRGSVRSAPLVMFQHNLMSSTNMICVQNVTLSKLINVVSFINILARTIRVPSTEGTETRLYL